MWKRNDIFIWKLMILDSNFILTVWWYDNTWHSWKIFPHLISSLGCKSEIMFLHMVEYWYYKLHLFLGFSLTKYIIQISNKVRRNRQIDLSSNKDKSLCEWNAFGKFDFLTYLNNLLFSEPHSLRGFLNNLNEKSDF